MHRLAAIDIGTVTTRLLVADLCGPNIRPICRAAHITDLGEGVAGSKHLLPAAMERVEKTVADYLELVRDCESAYRGFEARPVEKIITLATSAARDADNSDEFKEILACMGLELSVIPGSREAELSFLGTTSSFPGDDTLVVDIGGGSTEVVLGGSHQELSGPFEVKIKAARSFDLGARRLTELYLKGDPPTHDELQEAFLFAVDTMKEFFDTLPVSPKRIIAVAGTATTLVAIARHLDQYDPDVVHGTILSTSVLESVMTQLAAVPLERRERVVGLEKKRAPVIVGGLIILQAIMQMSGIDTFTVSESDILQGILLDAARKLG